MIVAGGVYYERCFSPNVEELYGSGGRAAVAVSSFTSVKLHTFFPDDARDDVIFNMGAFGVEAVTYPSPSVIEFFYHFPLSPPRIAPIPLPVAEPIKVTGDQIIRFGCLEGEIVTESEVAVFDPQSGGRPQAFGANGSRAQRLAMVLNEGELATLSQGDGIEAKVRNLTDRPSVVIVKSGPHGAFVFENGERVGRVPVYRSSRVYKIGSGDIFTAMFGFWWMKGGLSPLEAADRASRYVAHYVETRVPQMPESLPTRPAWSPINPPRTVYLAGSFFTTEHLWLVEETRAALRSLGIPCFSPMHDVGVSTAHHVAKADLAGLDRSHVVLAMVSDRDPGTLFEIGYAIKLGLKVIAVAENPGPQDLTMIKGTGCQVESDLATAIYEAAWASME